MQNEYFPLHGGGKPNDLKDVIQHGIRFNPASMIVKVLLAGTELLCRNGSAKSMSISAEEATYCIFNDLRVTSGKMSPEKIAGTKLENRRNKVRYYNVADTRLYSSKDKSRSKGDVVRYAGDILDYMTLADMLDRRFGYYSLKGNQKPVMDIFSEDAAFFKGYKRFIGEADMALGNCIKEVMENRERTMKYIDMSVSWI